MKIGKGLYAITDEKLIPEGRLTEYVERAIKGGARVVQYRNKLASPAQRRREAGELRQVCQRRHVPLIINDDSALALEVGAAGVHLGCRDGAVAEVRGRLGNGFLIGVSCYDRLELALEAEAAGADYVAFGSFFPSPTKPNAVRPHVSLVAEAKARLRVPVVAIGGITADNGGPLVAAGADLLAVISAVFGADEVESGARRIAVLYEQTEIRD